MYCDLDLYPMQLPRPHQTSINLQFDAVISRLAPLPPNIISRVENKNFQYNLQFMYCIANAFHFP